MSDLGSSLGCVELDGEFFEVYEEYNYIILWPHMNGREPTDYDDLCENSTMSITCDNYNYCTTSGDMSDDDFNKIREWFKENGGYLPPRAV